MTRRVAIIGAGPGGLATAMLLAKAGVEVTLHERQGHVGGRSATIVGDTAAGQFRFDTGPTFFLYPASWKTSSQPAAGGWRRRWS